MNKIKIGMFGRIVLAILGGVVLGFLLLHAGAVGTIGLRILKTFNVLFAQVLKFIVPLLILGLVTPAIADAGKGAGKLLVTVMILSYISTCAASLFGYVAAGQLLPYYVAKGAIATAGKGMEVLPYVDLKIPPLCDVLTALALAFMIGVGAIVTGSESVKRWFEEFGEIVKLTIMKVIIPGLPIYIMTMICEMTASGRIAAIGGNDVQGDWHGVGAYDRFSHPLVFACGSGGAAQSTFLPVEHGIGLLDGAFDRVILRRHTGDARLLREERYLEGRSEFRRAALRECAYGRQRHQADDEHARGGDHLRTGSFVWANIALHTYVRDCRSRGPGCDVRRVDGVRRVRRVDSRSFARAGSRDDDILYGAGRIRTGRKRDGGRRNRVDLRTFLRT